MRGETISAAGASLDEGCGPGLEASSPEARGPQQEPQARQHCNCRNRLRRCGSKPPARTPRPQTPPLTSRCVCSPCPQPTFPGADALPPLQSAGVVFKKTGFRRFLRSRLRFFCAARFFTSFTSSRPGFSRGGVTPELFEGGKIVCRV